jgi:chromosomal replication initiator protein
MQNSKVNNIISDNSGLPNTARQESLTKNNSAESVKELFLKDFLATCQEEIGSDTVAKWIVPLEIYNINDSELVFLANSKFIRDWVIREFIEVRRKKGNLKVIAQKIIPSLKKISVIYLPKKQRADSANGSSENSGEKVAKTNDSHHSARDSNKIVSISKLGNVFAFATELNPKYNFKNFITAKYNKLAVSMAKIATGFDCQEKLFDDNIPLFIHGGVGMGKTHLAQAIAWQLQQKNSEKRVIYLSAEKFMFHFVQSIRANDLISFKEKMRMIDVLIVDDLQFIAGKQSTQQEFMNSFNSLVEDNKQVVLVCDRHPNDLENIDEKLKSRISGGMVINFRNPDYEDRLQILVAKALQNKCNLDHSLFEIIASNLQGSIRDLEGVINKIIAEQLILKQKIDKDSIFRILQDYQKSYSQHGFANNSSANNSFGNLSNKGSSGVNFVDINNIKKIVAQFYSIKIADFTSSRRLKLLTLPRQIAIYLAKELTNLSLAEIGNHFGNKHHATIIHSCKAIKKVIAENNELKQQVSLISRRITNN